MLSIGTIEILLAAGLVSILALIVVVLHGAAVRFMERRDQASSQGEEGHREQHALAHGANDKRSRTTAPREVRLRRDRAA